MIPSSTGAAKALHLVIPELKGKLDVTPCASPHPMSASSTSPFSSTSLRPKESVNAALKAAATAHEGHSRLHGRGTRLR